MHLVQIHDAMSWVRMAQHVKESSFTSVHIPTNPFQLLCFCYLVSGEISSNNKIIPLLKASLPLSSLSMRRDHGI